MPATKHTRSMCTGHAHSETSEFLNLHKYLPNGATHCTVKVKPCSHFHMQKLPPTEIRELGKKSLDSQGLCPPAGARGKLGKRL